MAVETFRSGQDTCHSADSRSALILTVFLRTLDCARLSRVRIRLLRLRVTRSPSTVCRLLHEWHSVHAKARRSSSHKLQHYIFYWPSCYLMSPSAGIEQGHHFRRTPCASYRHAKAYISNSERSLNNCGLHSSVSQQKFWVTTNR